MKTLQRFFALFCLFCAIVTNAKADAMSDCMTVIGQNQQGFIDVLSKEIFPNTEKLDDAIVKKNKNKILTLIAGNIGTLCNKNFEEIVSSPTGKVSFELKNQKYAFLFNTSDVFDFLDVRTGIMVYNNRTKTAGDVIKVGDINKLYWSDECSDHTIWDNLDDDAAVNQAGQKSFTSYGGSSNEYFLDFEEGNNRRAFPGLVLMDETSSTTEKIVTFKNLTSAIDAAKKFQSALKNSACSSQGLAVYVVGLDVKADSTNKDGWALGIGIAGGALMYVGIVSTAAIASAGSAGVAAAISLALGVTWVPVVGWIVAGVAVAAAGITALVPGNIEDIKQVMVIAGPYNI